MYDLHEQENNEISNRNPDAITRVKKRIQQCCTACRLGGRPRSTANSEQVGEAQFSRMEY